jgi:hypothetical protein
MDRLFVHHDESGTILAVAAVRTMSDEFPHPFLLTHDGHGVIELSADHPVRAGSIDELPRTHRVDVTTRQLVAVGGPPAPGGRRRAPNK